MTLPKPPAAQFLLSLLSSSVHFLFHVVILHTEQLCKDFSGAFYSELPLQAGSWARAPRIGLATCCLLKCQLPKLKDLSPKSITACSSSSS